MKYLRKIGCLVSIAVLISFCSTKVEAANGVSDRIESFDTEITVNRDGTITILEKISYNLGNEPAHGVDRKIPLIKLNKDNKRYALKVSNVRVFADERRSRELTHEETKVGDNLRVRIGDDDKYVTGIYEVSILYDVSGALTYFEDFDELYWNITGNDSGLNILQASSKVILPKGATLNARASCYTGVKDAKEKECSTSILENIVYIKSNRNLGVGEGLTLAINFNTGIVAELEPEPAPIINPWILILLGAYLIVIYLVTPLIIFLVWLKDRNRTNRLQRVVAAWFEPPKRLNGTPVSPAEAGLILDKGTNQREISSTIINLAQRGYLKIKVSGNEAEDLTLSKDYLSDTSLQPHESLILNSLFEGKQVGDKVLISDLKKSTKLGKQLMEFPRLVEQVVMDNKLFKTRPSYYSIGFMVLTVISFMSLAVPTALVAFFFGRKAAPRTDEGIQKYSEATSLKNFLVSQDEQLNFQAKNQIMFERLLPYATAFGVEKIWVSKFKDIVLSKPDWVEGNGLNSASYLNMSNSLLRTTNSARAAYTRTNSQSSRGFSSGFSGGRSGGGGGGGSVGRW